MSLLADKDYLLQSLQLSYIRHVLPSHSSQTSLQGIGPHNLISFDSNSPIFQSPYVVLAGLTDESKWPELKSGRNSPPLSLGRVGESSNSGSGIRNVDVNGNVIGGRRRGHRSTTSNINAAVAAGIQAQPLPATNGGGLNYSQTIVGKGSGKSGAGMRVGGRERTWKGKNGLNVENSSGSGSNLVDEFGAPVSIGRSRRKSLETALHISRIGLDPSSIQRPPPVIIHSPSVSSRQPIIVAEEGDGEDQYAIKRMNSIDYSDDDEVLSGDLDDDSPRDSRGRRESSRLGEEDDEGDESEGRERLSHNSFEDDSSADDSLMEEDGEDDEDDDEGDNFITPLPLSDISETTGVLSSIQSASLTNPNLITPFSNVVQSSESVDTDGLGSSLNSSGISLFGVNKSSVGGVGSINRDRSNSGTSSLRMTKIEPQPQLSNLESIPQQQSQPSEPTEQSSTTTNPTEFVLPKGMKVRERRRVNISGRILLPIVEPSHEEPLVVPSNEITPAVEVVELEQQQPVEESTTRPRASTDPSATTPKLDKVEESSNELSKSITTPITPIKLNPPSTSKLPLLRTSSLPKPKSLTLPPTPSRATPSLTFPRSQTSPFNPSNPTSSTNQPRRSALTALLSAKSSSTSASNPFSTLYAASISKATDCLKLNLYFPHSTKPSKVLKIGIKKDLTVEEVIGVGLWEYWEEGREPKIELEEDEGIENETTKWNLRIVEDDGEVDEDFPALDRSRAVSAFSFGEFAIVKATEQQVRDNKAKQSRIQRRPSRVLAPPKKVGLNLQQPPEQGSNSLRTQIELKIKLPPTLPGNEIKLEVPIDIYISDLLELICRKHNLPNSRDWALTIQQNNTDFVLPLDRTLESVGGSDNLNELILVKRDGYGIGIELDSGKLVGGGNRLNTNNLNSSNRPKSPSNGLNSNYQRFVVQRKLPMPLGRHARTIVIDGDYIHLMGSDSKGILEGGKTSSFQISNLIQCKQSKRSPYTSFKLIFKRGSGRVEKRFEFECDSMELAREIVDCINRVKSESTRAGNAGSGRGGRS